MLAPCAAPLQFDFEEAQRFATLLGRGDPDTKLTLLALDDDKSQNRPPSPEKHGALAEFTNFLNNATAKGYGIFVTVNETNLTGRRKENIVDVRALFTDQDGAPIGPVLGWEVPPDIVVESSRGKFHCYWLNDGSVTLANFDTLQHQLGDLFGGDPQARDLSRVLRLPGSWHQKVSKEGLRSEPFQTRIVKGAGYEW